MVSKYFKFKANFILERKTVELVFFPMEHSWSRMSKIDFRESINVKQQEQVVVQLLARPSLALHVSVEIIHVVLVKDVSTFSCYFRY